jgi:hypothetical protein
MAVLLLCPLLLLAVNLARVGIKVPNRLTWVRIVSEVKFKVCFEDVITTTGKIPGTQ